MWGSQDISMIRKLILIQFIFLFITILIPIEGFAHLMTTTKGGGGGEAPIFSRYVDGNIQLTTDTQSDQWRESFVKDIHSLWGHEVSVRTLNNGTHIFFLLSWSDPTMATEKDLRENMAGPNMMNKNMSGSMKSGMMSDGAFIIFESTRAGQQSKDVWYWSTGTGTGANTISFKEGVITKAQWNKGNWTVIIGREIQPKNGDESAVSFLPGIREEAFVKFLVWDGSRGESFTAVDDETLAHSDFILLPPIDVYPKDVYIWSSVIAAGAVVFLFVDQKVYRNQQTTTTYNWIVRSFINWRK